MSNGINPTAPDFFSKRVLAEYDRLPLPIRLMVQQSETGRVPYVYEDGSIEQEVLVYSKEETHEAYGPHHPRAG